MKSYRTLAKFWNILKIIFFGQVHFLCCTIRYLHIRYLGCTVTLISCPMYNRGPVKQNFELVLFVLPSFQAACCLYHMVWRWTQLPGKTFIACNYSVADPGSTSGSDIGSGWFDLFLKGSGSLPQHTVGYALVAYILHFLNSCLFSQCICFCGPQYLTGDNFTFLPAFYFFRPHFTFFASILLFLLYFTFSTA